MSKKIFLLLLSVCVLLTGCGDGLDIKGSAPDNVSSKILRANDGASLLSGEDTSKIVDGFKATFGTKTYRGFVIDNLLQSDELGDIRFNLFVPASYDGSKPFALYMTLPGYEGLYFQGVAQNLKSEDFAFEAQKYNSEMIIVAPQLSDWGETSAEQTIALTEYFLDNYNIDRTKVYANGFSGGGETMSIVVGKRPDLFTAYLHVSSQWDGDYEPVAKSRLPVYLAVGENDEYYGSGPTEVAYQKLYSLYAEQGLSKSDISKLLVLDIKPHDYFTEKGVQNEHAGGGLFAFDKDIMGWLFSK